MYICMVFYMYIRLLARSLFLSGALCLSLVCARSLARLLSCMCSLTPTCLLTHTCSLGFAVFPSLFLSLSLSFSWIQTIAGYKAVEQFQSLVHWQESVFLQCFSKYHHCVKRHVTDSANTYSAAGHCKKYTASPYNTLNNLTLNCQVFLTNEPYDNISGLWWGCTRNNGAYKGCHAREE